MRLSPTAMASPSPHFNELTDHHHRRRPRRFTGSKGPDRTAPLLRRQGQSVLPYDTSSQHGTSRNSVCRVVHRMRARRPSTPRRTGQEAADQASSGARLPQDPFPGGGAVGRIERGAPPTGAEQLVDNDSVDIAKSSAWTEPYGSRRNKKASPGGEYAFHHQRQPSGSARQWPRRLAREDCGRLHRRTLPEQRGRGTRHDLCCHDVYSFE